MPITATSGYRFHWNCQMVALMFWILCHSSLYANFEGCIKGIISSFSFPQPHLYGNKFQKWSLLSKLQNFFFVIILSLRSSSVINLLQLTNVVQEEGVAKPSTTVVIVDKIVQCKHYYLNSGKEEETKIIIIFLDKWWIIEATFVFYCNDYAPWWRDDVVYLHAETHCIGGCNQNRNQWLHQQTLLHALLCFSSI